MSRTFVAYIPAFAWAVFIWFLGGRRDLPGPTLDLPVDKVAHFFIYGVLGALAAHGWQRSGRRSAWVWPLVAVLLLGAGDELRQRAVAGRSAEVADWGADAAGAIAAFLWIGRRGLRDSREETT